MIKKISFPPEERAQLKDRHVIITTRVDREYHKYHPGEVVQSPWGGLYRVINCTDIPNLSAHPYYAQLTEDQKKLLSAYDKIEVLTLQKEEMP